MLKTNWLLIYKFSYKAPSSVAAFFLVTLLLLLDTAPVLFLAVFAVVSLLSTEAVLPVTNQTTCSINHLTAKTSKNYN